MWIQACLNGTRTLDEHPKVPLKVADIAADAKRVSEVGATALHVHVRDENGQESIAPEVVARNVTAIREACPELEIGISTSEYLEPDLTKRIAHIENWTVLPDYVSANLAEEGIEDTAEVLLRRGVGLEGGLWNATDAQRLLTLKDVPWLRFLVEPWDEDPVVANKIVDEIEEVIDDAFPEVTRLVHGTDGAVWSLVDRAARGGHVTRIGLEDTLLLPTGELASDNAQLVQTALIHFGEA